MIRLPRFTYVAARSIAEAVDHLAASPSETMLLAGGTDLLPNMKRRQQVPRVVVGLRGVPELGSDRGQTGVRPGSDRGQTGVRPGSNRGQTRV